MGPALVGVILAAAVSTSVPVCTPTDPGLTELSGLAQHEGRFYATGDGGAALRVPVLDPATCATVDVVTAPGDPRDVEDLAVAADGTVWLADTGDNRRTRTTVALFAVKDGAATLYRLRYPDGPHDGEALLLEHGGRPVIVTKEITGVAGIYAPAGPLVSPGPVDLVRLGQLVIAPTDTPGGPVGQLGSIVVTGGAVSPDGAIVAVRTYTDAYVFAAPDGNAVTALAGRATRVPLPGEPQGEAVAVTDDGRLISGSEAAGGSRPPIRAVTDVRPAPAATSSSAPATPASPTTSTAPTAGSGVNVGTGAVLAVLVAGLAVWLVGLLTRRRR